MCLHTSSNASVNMPSAFGCAAPPPNPKAPDALEKKLDEELGSSVLSGRVL